MKLKIITLLFLLNMISSCNLLNDSPDKVFQVIGLNANKIPKSEEEINNASIKLDDTKGIVLDKKYEDVMKLLLPYADKNGIEYKTF